MLAKKKMIDGSNIKTFRDLQNALDASFEDMLELVESSLHVKPYTLEEICSMLDVTRDQLKSAYFRGDLDGGKFL